MTFFDGSNWSEYMYHYIVIVIIIFIVAYFIYTTQGPELNGRHVREKGDGNGNALYLGRGSIDEPSNVLLDRIEWSSYLNRRISFWQRAFLMTLIALILIIMFAVRRLPKPTELVMLFICIFIPIVGVNSFFYTHGDVYNDYYIKMNAQMLRHKLGHVKNDPPEPTATIPDRPLVMF